MKIAEDWEWEEVGPEEAARSLAWWRWGRDFEGEAWRQVFTRLCENSGGHAWYLHIDPDDGVWLSCTRCHKAGVNDVYPDGSDLLTGEFKVCPGYVLGLRYGDVELNGESTLGLFTYGWKGPVTVRLHTEKHYCWEYGSYEYDVWIEVDPA